MNILFISPAVFNIFAAAEP